MPIQKGLTKVNNKIYYLSNNTILNTDGISVDSVLKSDFIIPNYAQSGLFNGYGKPYFRTSFEFDNFNYGHELWSIGKCTEQNNSSIFKSNSLVFNKVQIPSTNKKCHCDIFNSLIATTEPLGANPLKDDISSRVWTDNTIDSKFLKKHFELNQSINPDTATGKITLYFSQNDFDDYNNFNSNKLPINKTDNIGIRNLLIKNYSGVSYNLTGLPNSYTGQISVIKPSDKDIVWNTSLNRWEITFETMGLGGFFITTYK